MSLIIRVIVVVACAYAGSVVARIQLPDLPDPYQMAPNS
jgi:hypothetical protein